MTTREQELDILIEAICDAEHADSGGEESRRLCNDFRFFSKSTENWSDEKITNACFDWCGQR
jgi:hypothetical protein